MSGAAAETLRRAASLMRKRAEAASTGPWKSWQEGRDHRGGDSFIQSTDEPDNTDLYVTVGRNYHPKWSADQDYVASMHPGVGMAVAEWLETEAHMADVRGNSVEGHTFGALKVARAYLGEVTV